ncbi:MAG TPA: hypothetical protein VGM25_11825 [Caulobacteraceae bacterium]|jgi:hypothetical protein
MPALLFTAALASGQPSVETVRTVDPAAPARVSVVQDLSAIVSGSSPFGPSAAPVVMAAGTGAVTIRQSGGAGIVSTSVNTGVGSVAQAATAVSARLVLPNLAAVGPRG